MRILAKGSDTAPFGAVSALLQKVAENLPYKIHKDFSTSVNKWEPFISFERATISRRDSSEFLRTVKRRATGAHLAVRNRASLELFNEIRRRRTRNRLFSFDRIPKLPHSVRRERNVLAVRICDKVGFFEIELAGLC